MGLTSNPKPEVFMRFGSFWIGERDNELFNFLHKFETKLTVLKHNPVA